MIKLTEMIAPTYGKPEDVAPVQVMLARAKHRLRPFWRGEIDGQMTPALRTAIEIFQYEAGILAPPLQEQPGVIHPDGPTIAALKAAVPRSLLRMRVLPGTAEVFLTLRSSRVLQAELDWLRAEGPPHGAGPRRDLAEVVERCYRRIGLQIKVVDSRLRAGCAEVRLGVKALSLPLPGGVFHTVPVASPWLVPRPFWDAIQREAGAFWAFQPAPTRGRGWLRATRPARSAA